MLGRDADILVSEATYADDEIEKAAEFKHMTGSQAAQVAQAAQVKRLLITHFSQALSTVEKTLDEARAIFPKTDAAFDLMKIRCEEIELSYKSQRLYERCLGGVFDCALRIH